MHDRNRVNILQIRRRMGVDLWRPSRPFGDDGWVMDNVGSDQRIIVSYHGVLDGHHWLHASISNRYEGLPSHDDMARLHRAVWGEAGWAYEIRAPIGSHINIHPRALHLWGRLDGQPALPDFAGGGLTI